MRCRRRGEPFFQVSNGVLVVAAGVEGHAKVDEGRTVIRVHLDSFTQHTYGLDVVASIVETFAEARRV